jgi:hypothetical protein
MTSAALPEWSPANNGAGKRIWFLARGHGAEFDRVPVEARYHCGADGSLVRYASMASAQRAADTLNAAEKFDDATATWKLLSEDERRTLVVLGRYKGNTVTPGMLGRELRVTWQRAGGLARSLKRLGLVTVRSLPKQTTYGISGQGETCLAAGQAD